MAGVSCIEKVSSFEEMASLHCNSFPVELLYRLSTGQLSEIYGPDYFDIDCYVRQFVNKGTPSPMQMAKILLSGRRRTRMRTKKRKMRMKQSRRNFHRSTRWLLSTPRASLAACRRGLTRLRPPMRFGGLCGSSCSTTTRWSGCGPRSERHWGTRRKGPVLGWTGSRPLPGCDWTSCFPTNSTTTWTR